MLRQWIDDAVTMVVALGALPVNALGVLATECIRTTKEKDLLAKKYLILEREKNMSKRVEKLLALTVGEVREQLAFMESDMDIKDWLYDYAELPDTFDEDILIGLYDDEEDEDCDEEDYCDEDYDDEDDDEELEVGTALPNPDQEALAQEIAFDIVNRRYPINSLAGLYSPEFIVRVQELTR